MNGLINVFKPKGITSHDAVNRARKIFNTKRIGHTGTLDPNVTGVLPLCIGKATRVSEYLLDLDKEYVGELTLGIETDTQDMWGKALNKSEKSVTKTEIHDVFKEYTGKLEQLPPMYSAVRHKGRKLYELAREGKTIERKPRRIYVHDLNILKIIDNQKIIFSIKCSKGTYVRTLCNDMGKSLGTYGYMSYLIRTGVGDFNIADSISFNALGNLKSNELNSFAKSMDVGLQHLDSMTIDAKYYKSLTNGASIDLDSSVLKIKKIDTPLRVYSNNIFIGIGQIAKRNNKYYCKMNKVLI